MAKNMDHKVKIGKIEATGIFAALVIAAALALIGRNLFPNLTQWGYLYSVEGYSIYAGEILLAVFDEVKK